MQIPTRLKVIADLIPEGARIADIGADHGLLEQYIAVSKEKYFVLAIENKSGPFSTLLNNVGCLQNIIVSHSDGLNQVTKDYDTLVLAGMGGDNIIEILSKKIAKLKYLKQVVVDAHSFIPKVRRFMVENGFDIEREKIVFEKKHFYIIISFNRNENKNSYNDEELDFGYKLYEDALFKDYQKSELKKLNTIAKKVCKKDNEKYNQICEEIRRLKTYGQN